MAKGTNSMSSEKSINSETLESLRSEYSQLTALFGNYFMMPYNVIPLAVTICGALTLYGESRKEFWGVIVSYGMVLLLAWLSYIHTFINGVGLRLVELECRINSLVGESHENGLQWFSIMIADGNRVFLGLLRTTVVVALFGVILYIASFVVGWEDLQKKIEPKPAWVGFAILLLPGILMVALLWSMRTVEIRTRRKKQKILQKFESLGNAGERAK